MSDRIITSPEVLRNFAREIQRFLDDQEQILQRLHSSYTSVGTEWNDAQYVKFGENMNDIVNQIRSIIPTCTESIQYLERKAQALENYLAN